MCWRGTYRVSGSKGDASIRLRQLLEKLELDLRDSGGEFNANRGLGSNNLLFMACELLLLGSETEGFPLLLVEEARSAFCIRSGSFGLCSFFNRRRRIHARTARTSRPSSRHTVPNLASAIRLDNLVLLSGGKAFSPGRR